MRARGNVRQSGTRLAVQGRGGSRTVSVKFLRSPDPSPIQGVTDSTCRRANAVRQEGWETLLGCPLSCTPTRQPLRRCMRLRSSHPAGPQRPLSH